MSQNTKVNQLRAEIAIQRAEKASQEAQKSLIAGEEEKDAQEKAAKAKKEKEDAEKEKELMELREKLRKAFEDKLAKKAVSSQFLTIVLSPLFKVLFKAQNCSKSTLVTPHWFCNFVA